MAGLVEKLVDLVGSAFYTDEHIAVLRALVREKFLKDDEMGSAVNLQTRQVRKIITELHQDHLVCEEVLNDKRLGGSSSTSYWYIDYKYFVEVVQYRLYIMQEHLKESEKLEIERQTYQCKDPDCGREYTALEAQLLLMPGQYHFRCGHCNELLLECDNNDRLEKVQNLQRKLKDQMNRQSGMHEGIFEILRRIGDIVREGNVLPTNLPSENRAAGIGGKSTRLREGASNSNGGGRGGSGGATGSTGARGADGPNAQSFLYPYGQEREIVVDIAGNDVCEDEYILSRKRKAEDGSANKPAKATKEMPAFLMGSSISGHLAAKHQPNTVVSVKDEGSTTVVHNMIPFVDNELTEEQRTEAFKLAYLAEMTRYQNQDKETFEIKFDKRGGGDINEDGIEEEELEDIEWEWFEEDRFGVKTAAEITVKGKIKRLDMVDDDDLQDMTDGEFMEFYRLRSSQT